MSTELVFIQVKDISGNWYTVQTVMRNDNQIKQALDNAVTFYKKQARAQSASGSLIDVRFPDK